MRRDLSITFAGGGSRAFYQLGLLQKWQDRVRPRLAGVAACSAGACVVLLWLSERVETTHLFWERRRSFMTRNFDFSRLLRAQRPTPHGEVYRDTMMHSFEDGGFERIKQQPFPVLVLAAAPPPRLPIVAALPLGFAAYSIEKRLNPRLLHPRAALGLGFRPVVYDARDCETPEELADLVLASSATPPFTRVGSFRGRRLLDGGLVDNIPASVADDIEGVARNLVLLTRPYPEGVAGRVGNRLYLAPTEPVPIARWDYTRPDLVRETVALGERDAERHSAAIDRLLG